MTAKEFLKQYDNMARRVRRLETELEEQRIMIDAVRSLSDNDGLPHGNGISKPTEDRAVRIADKAIELSQARLDAIEARQRVFDVIVNIDGVPGDVLYLRYIKLKRWEEICVEVHRSWRQIHRDHAEGLVRVSAIIENMA